MRPAGLVLALLLLARAVGAAEAGPPAVRPLEREPDPAPAAPDAAPARRLPATVAVCRDGPGRCRTAARPEDCGGLDRVFRVVPGDAAGADAAAALAECRLAPAAPTN